MPLLRSLLRVGIVMAFPVAAAAAVLEDPQLRAQLPEFKYIPAATPDELSPAAPLAMDQFAKWTRSQGDNGARRYSTLKQITKENVRELKMEWTYRAGDGKANIQCTPIVVDGLMIAPTPGRAIVGIDAQTGKERWRMNPDPGGSRIEDQPARRGLVYWPGDQNSASRVLFGAADWIYAIDPKTGRTVEEFGERGRSKIPTGATAAGAVYRDVFVTTGIDGDVYGYNVRDGKQVWRFRSIARGEDFGAETWDGPQAGANGWSGLTVDDTRGIAFIALGAPRPDMVGVRRKGDNLFSNCVVALDALTGRRIWHFQDVRHDIWDLDVCAPPNLLTIEREGRKVDVVTSMAKSGHLFVLDRMTGKPVFPVRLRRAPVSRLPGEVTAAYQPDPEIPEPISRSEFHPNMITDRTPEARDFVTRIVERSTYGFFEPFTEGRPNLYIGTRGGAEWSGAAVDLPTGRLYVTSNRAVSKITVFSNTERERDPKYPPSAGERVYEQTCAACHGPFRLGVGIAPPLVGLRHRSNDQQVLDLLATGRGTMPPMTSLSDENKSDLLDFLFRRNQPPSRTGRQPGSDDDPPYVFDGFNFLLDHEGFPGIKPPWGLLNCYDLNTGKVLWRVPLGELEELTARGMPVTGAQNYGGATVTAGGLVFVSGTQDEQLRAFDADTGEQLWSAKLPFQGSAAPAIYESGGRQFVVITSTGRAKFGGSSGLGDAYVAFALPK